MSFVRRGFGEVLETPDITELQAEVDAHKADIGNPHGVMSEQVGIHYDVDTQEYTIPA